MKGIQMYTKIQEMKAQGFSQNRTAIYLNIHRDTVNRYWNMTADDYREYSEKNQILSFSTITKENIVLFEDLGKYSTHEIWYNYTQQDIKQLIIKYRKIIEELICKAGLVQKGN